MGKIIFLDVDGTLVDYDGHTPESAVRAVRTARRRARFPAQPCKTGGAPA